MNEVGLNIYQLLDHVSKFDSNQLLLLKNELPSTKTIVTSKHHRNNWLAANLKNNLLVPKLHSFPEEQLLEDSLSDDITERECDAYF